MNCDMMTFDQLRSILLGPEPHVGLDRLIRAELACGRTTKAIYDELLGYLDSVRAMPDYTDTLEDPLGDSLDALCGWCHPAHAYKDSPEPNVTATTPPSSPSPEVPSTPRHV
jgi:hypothetical protein